MRYIAMALAALVLLMSGCQDDSLLEENKKLRESISELKTSEREAQDTATSNGAKLRRCYTDTDVLQREVQNLKEENWKLRKDALTKSWSVPSKVRAEVCADPEKFCGRQSQTADAVPKVVHCKVPTDTLDILMDFTIPDYSGRYLKPAKDGAFAWDIGAAPSGLPEAFVGDFYPWRKQPPLESPCEWEYREVGFHEKGCVPKGLYDEDGKWNLTQDLVDRCAPKIWVSWEYLFDQRLFALGDEPNSYRDWKEGLPAIRLVYGILGAGNRSLFDRNPEYYNHFLRTVMPRIYRSKRHLAAMFKWIMPPLKVAFGQLPLEDRVGYVEIIDDSIAYLESFRLAREDAYLARLRRGECGIPEGRSSEHWDAKRDCVHRFTSFGPDSSERDDYRKAHAFIYRRAKQGVPPKLMLSYLRQARAQLAPLAK